jgi:hypothetical protein
MLSVKLVIQMSKERDKEFFKWEENPLDKEDDSRIDPSTDVLEEEFDRAYGGVEDPGVDLDEVLQEDYSQYRGKV